MYFYDPRGMLIFEMTSTKLKEGGGVRYSVSRELLISGVDKRQTYHSLFRVIEALDELNSSTLPSSTRTDKGCGLS